MGLDWLAGNKPKPGFETEFRELLDAKARGEEASEQTIERFHEISLAAYTQVGAPIVGTDSEADAWVLLRVRSNELEEQELQAIYGDDIDLSKPENAKPRDDDERETLTKMEGYRVLELAPPCDGLPRYTMGAFSDHVDLTSFRGKFLHDCEDIIGEELLEKAYEDHMPDELVEFGNTLLEHAKRFAADNDCEHVADMRELPDDDESEAAHRAHILFAAGRWCVYWGSRGHFLDTWF